MLENLFQIGFVLAFALPPVAVLVGVALIALPRPARGFAAPTPAIGTAK